MRRPREHQQFLPYLAPEERQEYDDARKRIGWLRERLSFHEAAMRRLELLGRRRKEDLMSSIKEAAE